MTADPKKAAPDFAPHRERRRRLLERMAEGSAALFPTSLPQRRNGDSDYRFRPDSDFHYLTGFSEPHALLALVRGRSEGEQVLFLQPRQREQEIWTGRRLGVERAREALGVDEARSIEELDQQLPALLRGRDPLYWRTGLRADLDAKVLAAVAALRAKVREGNPAPETIVDTAALLHEMRLRKDAHELATMRRAAAITTAAHEAAMRATRPGVFEYEIEALVEHEFRRRGADGPAYGTIVASGSNATILHYTHNDRRMEAGDLLLLDAGSEVSCYASDVTRTWPVSGRFAPVQRRVYDVVLEAQRRAIALVAPGQPFDAAHHEAVRTLIEGLIEMKLLSGGVAEIVESKAFRRFYMHRTGHWLGLDVHDAGAYFRQGMEHRALEPGMIVTVEPGLYFAEDDESIPPEYRGIGVRIEDDVLVTEGGPEVLTAACPKSPADLEALIGTAASV
jgi:Xaa-Pro aminopeptidase